MRGRPALPITVLLTIAALAGCSSAERAAHTVPTVPAPQGQPASFTTTAAADPAPASAASPQDAVARYVAAEASGDHTTSWSLLSDDERARVGSLAAWIDEAEARLPLVSLADVTVDGSTVVTDTALTPRLDETGFVPAHARIEWRPVRRGGGWAVAPSSTTVTALLPPDDAARVAVQTWLDGRRHGEATGEYAGNLLGQPRLVDGLAPSASLTAGTPAPLDTAPDPQVAVNAFGADAVRFVRAVPVSGAPRLVVLTAPLGDAWQVVGVQAPR